ncbi:MAG: glycosyltransferase [Candidatus Eremiobacteraeota bacterium]|nr:glycosyltransferase [Candidatus Eremiobacteraeota bacterium]
MANFLSLLVGQAAAFNAGTSPFDAEQLKRFTAIEARLRERAVVYEPAHVRESRVSVLVEAAGAPRPLLRALDSVAAQSFPNWDVVVVDHGSIPLEPVLRAHPVWERTSYVRLPTTNTAGAARNLALRMYRGEYVAFLDPDNRFAPNHLERAVDAIATTGALASLAEARLIVERTDGVATRAETVGEVARFSGEEDDVIRLEVAHTLRLDQVVLYRGMIDRIGRFNDAVPLLDDWDFLLRLVRATRFAPSGAVGVDVTVRLGLVAQRLGATLGHYPAILDALYAAHPAEPATVSARVRHRAEVVNAIGAANDWLTDPNGVAAFAAVLAGRPVPSPLAPVLQPA